MGEPGNRKKLVRDEMRKMLQEEFITKNDYDYFMAAYQDYYLHHEIQPNPEPGEIKQQLPEAPAKEEALKKKPKKEKKVRTPEQIRERNITWSLILGVSLLLISGLVIATSNWDQMSDEVKTGSIAFVALFFFVLSGIGSKVLKIDKTAFAFLTLGSLLLPITVIAIGFFELWGPYLSLKGEGKYILGLLGTLLPLPLYVWNAYKHQSRLFVWVSYLFLSGTVSFGLAAFDISIDLFFLLMMGFNAALLYSFYKLRDKKVFILFTKELPAYAQLNLIISTLLLLFFYDNGMFYSFNLLLTAAIYIAMVFVYDTKEYQFVFSSLFAYGAYQLVENTMLENVDFVVYAIVGFLYLGFAMASQKEASIARMFRYTSGAVSVLVFIYISYEGIMLRAENSSTLLLLGYIIITANYIALAYLTRHQIFRYLASVFLFVTGFQTWDVINQILHLGSPAIYMFLYGSAVLLLLGIFTENKYLLPIKTACFYTAVTVIGFCVLYSYASSSFLKLAFMLAVSSGLAYIIYKTRPNLRRYASWVNGLSMAAALLSLGPELFERFPGYSQAFHWPAHLGMTGLIVLAGSAGWERVKETGLAHAAFYSGQVTYMLGLCALASLFPIDGYIVRPMMLLIGIALSVWLVHRAGQSILWVIVPVLTFLFYFSMIIPLRLDSFPGVITFLMGSPVLLLAVERMDGRNKRAWKPYFFWFAHVITFLLTAVILLDQTFVQRINPLLLLVPVLLFMYSAVIRLREWQKKAFVYAAMTMIPLLIVTNAAYFHLFPSVPDTYFWFISSLVMAVIWLVAQEEWQGRMIEYLIVFSNVGLYAMIIERGSFPALEIIPIIAYILLNLYFLHYRKWTWGAILPLFASILAWEQERFVWNDYFLISVSIASYLVLTLIGREFYKQFYRHEKGDHHLDWYSVVALLYIFYTGTYIDLQESVWLQIIPFFMLALWLLVQVERFPRKVVQKSIQTMALLSLLPPYYLLADSYEMWIPGLLSAEVRALPILGLSVLLSTRTWSNYQKIMAYVQLAVLLFVTAYLVIDAIQSHTLYDAIIVGVLSLFSIVAGMHYRVKAYFFVGIGVLIFNVMYQTKPYWGNMPWWGYLLFAGFTLIGIASYNEWQKQRNKQGKTGVLEQKLKQLVLSFKNWD
ncbi:hypothetical protein [Thalassobacillus pellis]|uniref:hypothetical protein n=1 Tax=Thalassobacillus pellis TaxID=748008 RepID=UPI0019621DD9|nr:hypothetical protein [Thalassobacillus pellis]MBM7554195.1 hypothetical protein [Thalassobacillus pellis]